MSKREEEIRKLAYENYLDRGMIDGHDLEDWYKAEKTYQRGRCIWLIVSFMLFSAFLFLIYFNENLENFCIFSRCCANCFLLLMVILIGLGTFFYRCAWQFIESRYGLAINSNPTPPNGRFRDIHIARYNHLNEEITRYRDLVWKVVGFAWAIYYALIRFAEGSTCQTLSTSSSPKASLPIGWFFIFCFGAAIIATIFHAFCEIMVVRNQERRRSLETSMGLLPNWAHQETLERSGRLGFRFSVTVFGILIWAPPLIILILRASY